MAHCKSFFFSLFGKESRALKRNLNAIYSVYNKMENKSYFNDFNLIVNRASVLSSPLSLSKYQEIPW